MPSVKSPEAEAGFGSGVAAGTDAVRPSIRTAATVRFTRICSPVRLKKCWSTEPPQVATTLIRPAPAIVPYTPKEEASLAATTAARALPATWGTLRSMRLDSPFEPTSATPASSDLSRIVGPCLPFPYGIDQLHEKGTCGRNH